MGLYVTVDDIVDIADKLKKCSYFSYRPFVFRTVRYDFKGDSKSRNTFTPFDIVESSELILIRELTLLNTIRKFGKKRDVNVFLKMTFSTVKI